MATYSSTSFDMRALCAALCRNKIEYRVEKGDDQLCSSLLKATVDTTLFLVIFLENCESPAWCLNKLTKILEYSSDQQQQLVIFVFYMIDPSDVRKQIGSYQIEFAKQEHNNHNRDEHVHIGETVPCVLMKLDPMYQRDSKGLNGVYKRITHLQSLYYVMSHKVFNLLEV